MHEKCNRTGNQEAGIMNLERGESRASPPSLICSIQLNLSVFHPCFIRG